MRSFKKKRVDVEVLFIYGRFFTVKQWTVIYVCGARFNDVEINDEQWFLVFGVFLGGHVYLVVKDSFFPGTPRSREVVAQKIYLKPARKEQLSVSC